MKSFKSFISEEVLPTANVEDGHFSLENDAARADINAILAGICSKTHVTPYVSLRKISKALAYFSIILPKRTFLEGEKGIEVYEMMQFGAKIGMNDQGEFINQVPEKYYLFFQYRMADGKYTPFAKIVDKTGLDKLLSMAEVTMSEDCAYDKVTRSQRAANRDPMFKNDADGSESTKKAVATTQRKKERKLANGSLDDKEYDPEYVQGIKEELDGEGYETNNQLPDFDEEVRVTKWSDNSHTARVSKDGKVLGVHTRKKHSDLNKEIKSRFGLKGNIPQGEAPGKAKTHKIDEATSDTPEESAMVRTELRAMIDKANALLKALKTDKHVEPWVQSKVANAKGMLSGVHDYMIYGEGEENLDEMTSVKKSYAMRKMKTKVATQVKRGLGIGKEKTKTVLVTNKGDPKAASGGGVHRIPKDKYDPAKHNMASE